MTRLTLTSLALLSLIPFSMAPITASATPDNGCDVCKKSQQGKKGTAEESRAGAIPDANAGDTGTDETINTPADTTDTDGTADMPADTAETDDMPDTPAETAPAGTNGMWTPTIGSPWNYVINGTIGDIAGEGEKVFMVDLFDVSVDKIAELHAAGDRVICYYSAGSSENWRPDDGDIPEDARKKSYDGWPGEFWLDTTNPAVRNVMNARLDMAKEKGCDGVDPDNVDNGGGVVSEAEMIDFMRFTAEEAHARSLSVGLKNALGSIDQVVNDFDFAVNESCYSWNECDKLSAFISQGKPVYGVMYDMEPSEFCPDANAKDFDFLKKPEHQDLIQEYISCRDL